MKMRRRLAMHADRMGPRRIKGGRIQAYACNISTREIIQSDQQ